MSDVLDKQIAYLDGLMRRTPNPQFVYFIRASSDPNDMADAMVKVGITADIAQRFKQVTRSRSSLPGWLPLDIEANFTILGFVHGDNELERALHRTFAFARIAGEWFNYQQIEPQIDYLLDNHCICDSCLLAEQGATRAFKSMASRYR